MIRRHRYADGGKVVKDKKPLPRSTQNSKKPQPGMLGTGGAAKAAETLQSKRKKQMEDLGI